MSRPRLGLLGSNRGGGEGTLLSLVLVRVRGERWVSEGLPGCVPNFKYLHSRNKRHCDMFVRCALYGWIHQECSSSLVVEFVKQIFVLSGELFSGLNNDVDVVVKLRVWAGAAPAMTASRF